MAANDLVPAFKNHRGLPQPHWRTFEKRVAGIKAPDAHAAAWRLAAETWLIKLAKAVSTTATVFASKRTLILASPDGESLVAFAEKTIAHIDRLLDGIGSLERHGPHAIVVFDSHDVYYDYVDFFHPEGGAFGASAGMFISAGYSHVVVGPGDPWSRQCTIAHELTHDYLSSRELPLWLEEGLAQLMEGQAAGSPRAVIDREAKKQHRAFWSTSGLDSFWQGNIFSAAGEPQRLAYQLALVLVHNIITDASRNTADFVREAHYSDAGERAAHQVLGNSLSHYAIAFLGPGDWEPPAWDTQPFAQGDGQ